MISARDNSNAFLMDQVRSKERMRAMTATTHMISDEHIEKLVAWVVVLVIGTGVAIVWAS